MDSKLSNSAAIARAVQRLSRRLGRETARIAREYGLREGDWDIVDALGSNGPPYEATPTELYREFGITSGSLSPRLNRLVEAGLVERAAPTNDGRRRPVRLSREGERRWRAADAKRSALEERLIAGTLSAPDVERLTHLLRKLLAGLD